ncbi:MAG: hypothetical protein ACP5M0_05300 [Desulfomonilaceae bacterium]
MTTSWLPDRVRYDKPGAVTQALKVIIFTTRRASLRQKFREVV